MAIPGVQIHGTMQPGYETILTDAALAFVAQLHHMYEPTRQSLLEARRQHQLWWNGGNEIDFAGEMASVRADPYWQVRPAPHDLTDRRVEITGPCDRKMVVRSTPTA